MVQFNYANNLIIGLSFTRTANFLSLNNYSHKSKTKNDSMPRGPEILLQV